MTPTAHPHSAPMAPPTPDTADSPPRAQAADPPDAPGAAAAAARNSGGAPRGLMRAKMGKAVENAPAALLVGALVGLVPVVVTMMIYTLNTFGTRFDDTNRLIGDTAATLNTRIDDTAATLNTRIDDTNTHIIRLEHKMDARFAAQDFKISQLSRDVAQLSRDVAQVNRDITQVLALLLAQNRADPQPSAALAPTARQP